MLLLQDVVNGGPAEIAAHASYRLGHHHATLEPVEEDAPDGRRFQIVLSQARGEPLRLGRLTIIQGAHDQQHVKIDIDSEAYTQNAEVKVVVDDLAWNILDTFNRRGAADAWTENIKRGQPNGEKVQRRPAASGKTPDNHGMRRMTADALARLRAYRAEEIKRRGQIPKFTNACDETGIDVKTVKRWDPELHEKWTDKKYR